MKRRLRFTLALLTLIILISGQLSAERLASIEGLYFFQPAATVSGAESIWINPAGLGKTRAEGYLWLADYFEGELADDWGVVIHKKSLGVGYRSLERPDGKVREYRFGMGAQLGNDRTYWGFSYQYYKDGPPELHKKHLWNVGVLSQQNPKLAWAAVLSNLNRATQNDDRTEIEQHYSIAYRPKGDLVTLSADMLLGTKTRLSNADFIYHAEVTAKQGVYLTGWLDSDKNFSLGVRVNLLKHFVGSQSSFDRNGNDIRTTAYYGATSLRQKSVLKEKGRRLSLKMSGRVRENPPQPIFGRKATSFASLIQSINRAARDDSINEMVLRLSSFSPGFGRAQELRTALIDFRATGKRVICHLGRPGNLGYYIASVCNSILIPPVSQFNLTGLRAELTFYKGLMDKIGVRAEMLRIGDHKTGPERYTENESTDQNRAQVNRILDELYDQFVEGIASARDMKTEALKEIINQAPYTSTEALELGLVDGLSYADDLQSSFLEKMPEISFRSYQADTLTDRTWGRPAIVAVVPIEGEIAYGSRGSLISPPTEATPRRMARSLGLAVADPQVKAIVLRINSPGGLALAGDEIYHEVEKASRKKPVVISMANVAASGGYYVAMPGERIFVNPACVTGSIGIYGGKPDLSGLYEKLAVTKEIYTRGDNAALLSFSQPFTPEQKKKYMAGLQAFYDHFVALVSESRGLSIDSVDNLSRGRVWTGREAVANGLADQLGGLTEAAAYAAQLAGLDEYRVQPFPIRRPFFLWPELARIPFLGRLLKKSDNPLTILLDDESSESDQTAIYARLPFDLTIE